MNGRRIRWLVLAAVLFGLGAWVLWTSDQSAGAVITEKRAPSRRDLPRRQRQEERDRMLRRQTMLPAPPPDAGTVGPQRPFDPVLAALPPGAKRALVLEASAIRGSRIGEIILRCGLSTDALDRIRSIQSDAGIDVLDGVERVAVGDDVAIVSGDFRAARIEGLLKSPERRKYGGGAIYESHEEGRRPRIVGTWRDTMLIAARDAAEVERAIDRLEGRAPVAPPIDQADTYGEIYGTIDGSVLADLLAPDVRNRLKGAAQRIELHVDTRDENDVLIVADATGPDAASMADLGKSLGAALAVARVTAQSEGDDDLAKLLDLARVNPETGAFRVEAALPLDVIEKRLCDEDGGIPWRRRRGRDER